MPNRDYGGSIRSRIWRTVWRGPDPRISWFDTTLNCGVQTPALAMSHDLLRPYMGGSEFPLPEPRRTCEAQLALTALVLYSTAYL